MPSRLYFSPTESKPLHGQRITIKDNYRLSGVKTTMSSRPYEATYGRDNVTADFAHRLVQLGAVIVGKSKMSAFASSEEPTDQWVDFHAPFNPRGDGYQTPAGSSNGAAAALSGYPWLDFSLGTDSKWPVQSWKGLTKIRLAKMKYLQPVQLLGASVIQLRSAASTAFDIRHTQSRWKASRPVAGVLSHFTLERLRMTNEVTIKENLIRSVS